jgi:hypothetical protein
MINSDFRAEAMAFGIARTVSSRLKPDQGSGHQPTPGGVPVLRMPEQGYYLS